MFFIQLFYKITKSETWRKIRLEQGSMVTRVRWMISHSEGISLLQALWTDAECSILLLFFSCWTLNDNYQWQTRRTVYRVVYIAHRTKGQKIVAERWVPCSWQKNQVKTDRWSQSFWNLLYRLYFRFAKCCTRILKIKRNREKVRRRTQIDVVSNTW